MDPGGSETGLRQFSFEELQNATYDWAEMLGEGAFGPVYKGSVNGWENMDPSLYIDIAVKKMRPGSFQGYEQWRAEVFLLGALRHPHVVRLLGFCMDQPRGVLLLVYDFFPNGSLDYHLYGDVDLTPLTWHQRLNIALGAARGLDYLHRHNVVHRDFKPSNILLDQNLVASLTDFGLAKVLPEAHERTHVTTRILGTLGYLDPNYVVNGHLSTRSDVYSFGVVLLELFTGRRAASVDPDFSLVQWARPYLEQRNPDVKTLADPALECDMHPRVAIKIGHLIKFCLSELFLERPTMSDVVVYLQQQLNNQEQFWQEQAR